MRVGIGRTLMVGNSHVVIRFNIFPKPDSLKIDSMINAVQRFTLV